jgi:hypothetical protein
MRWMGVVALVGVMIAAGTTVAAEPPAEEVASSTRTVRGTALGASLAEGWRVADQRETPEGVVYDLSWGGGD